MKEQHAYAVLDNQEIISLQALAREMGINSTNIQRTVINRGFFPFRCRIGGRQVLALSRIDAQKFKTAFYFVAPITTRSVRLGAGGVYLLRPHPQCCPGRVKVGWADIFGDRLTSHRGICPDLEVLRLFKTDARWTENMAISLLQNFGEPISREVFDLRDYNQALRQLDQQFAAHRISAISEPDAEPDPKPLDEEAVEEMERKDRDQDRGQPDTLPEEED